MGTADSACRSCRQKDHLKDSLDWIGGTALTMCGADTREVGLPALCSCNCPRYATADFCCEPDETDALNAFILKSAWRNCFLILEDSILFTCFHNIKVPAGNIQRILVVPILAFTAQRT